MDVNNTGTISFCDLAYLLGIFLKGYPEEKITLFYKCHIPPAFNISDLNDLVNINYSINNLIDFEKTNGDIYGVFFF